METALRYDNATKNLVLHASENFVSDDNIILSCAGLLQTQDGTVSGEIVLRKKFFPEVNSRLSIGIGYDSQLENPFGEVKLRKRFELSEDGLCCLDFKAKYRYIRAKQFQSEQEAKAQISTKIFNFTEDQDLRLKFGYDVLNKSLYGQVRENNWSFNTDFKGYWGISYDL